MAEAKKADNNLFILQMRICNQNSSEINIVADVQTWHERLGHIGVHAIKEMSKRSIFKDLNVSEKTSLRCEACELAKSHRCIFKTNKNKAEYQLGELIHTDVSGPFIQ